MEENILQKKQNYQQRIANFREATELKKQTPREIIARGIKLSTKITEPEEVKILTDKVMKSESVAQNGNYDVFFFGIAESLEKIKSETSSMNEYFGWIDEAERIMKRMTDGFVSVQDLAEKKGFIDNSWQRETEILTCLSLYERSNHPMAKQRYAEMLLKLRRLRQLRSALINNTKSVPDREPLTQQEKARAIHVIKTLDEMRRFDEEGDYYNSTLQNHLRMLEMSHENDVEFYPNYSFYTRMLEDQRHADLISSQSPVMDYSMRLNEFRHKVQTKEEAREAIIRLTGRQPTTVEEHYVQSAERHNQAFNAENFRRIQALREKQMEGK